MNVLRYVKDEKWFEIQDWIDKNTKGGVSVLVGSRSYFHSGLAGELYEDYYSVTFSNSDDALFCKIKYPPTIRRT